MSTLSSWSSAAHTEQTEPVCPVALPCSPAAVATGGAVVRGAARARPPAQRQPARRRAARAGPAARGGGARRRALGARRAGGGGGAGAGAAGRALLGRQVRVSSSAFIEWQGTAARNLQNPSLLQRVQHPASCARFALRSIRAERDCLSTARRLCPPADVVTVAPGVGRLLGRIDAARLRFAHPQLPRAVATWLGCAPLQVRLGLPAPAPAPCPTPPAATCSTQPS